MLTLFGNSTHAYCDRVSRRSFLKAGGLAMGGLALPDVLRLQAQGAPTAAPKVKSVIMVILAGGPSHLDMYDLKPDAPAEYRGEFRPIATNVPGTMISEQLPLQAKLADKFSIVRSMKWFEPEQHELSEVCTAYTKKDRRPSFGATVSRMLPPRSDHLPSFVSLSGFYNENLRNFEAPQYAGAQHRPFYPHGPAIENLKLVQKMTVPRLQNRKQLLGDLDRLRRDMDNLGEFAGLDTYTTQALDMVASGRVQQAFDLSKEDPKTIARYGTKGVTFTYGGSQDTWDFEAFVRARRLAEAGVPVITLRVGTWDHHGGNITGDIFSGLRSQLPLYDKSVAALIEDLHERGLDKEVAVLVWGEFGRTPRINNIVGRDHWPDAGFAMFVGGGMKMGQMIGATDSRGEKPVTRAYTPQNVFATLYRLLGIDPGATIPDTGGRPMYLLDERDSISELI